MLHAQYAIFNELEKNCKVLNGEHGKNKTAFDTHLESILSACITHPQHQIFTDTGVMPIRYGLTGLSLNPVYNNSLCMVFSLCLRKCTHSQIILH